MTNPAAAIKDEVGELTQGQIEVFVRPFVLTPSELREYRRRSERLKLLYAELDRIKTRAFLDEQFAIGA